MSSHHWPTRQCQSCPTMMILAQTPAGKTMPMNPDPVTDPNGWRLTDRGPGIAPLVVKPSPGLAFGVPLYISHFATCPRADRHRRSRS